MANYYGIANFAQQFDQNRQNELLSGYGAKNTMRQDYLADQSMPAQMEAAQLAGQQGGINLDKLAAQQRVTDLQAQAYQQGLTNPSDIANYMRSNIDYGEVAANPYLSDALLANQRAAGQGQLQIGGAFGGALGASIASQGLAQQGYGGITAHIDQNGNTYYVGANGARSAPLTRAGTLPSAQAFGGSYTPFNAYNTQVEKNTYNAALQNAQLQAGRYGTAYNERLKSELSALQGLYAAEIKVDPEAAAATKAEIMRRLSGGAPTGPSGADIISGNVPSAASDSPPGAAPLPGVSASNAPLQPPIPPNMGAASYTPPYGMPPGGFHPTSDIATPLPLNIPPGGFQHSANAAAPAVQTLPDGSNPYLAQILSAGTPAANPYGS